MKLKETELYSITLCSARERLYDKLYPQVRENIRTVVIRKIWNPVDVSLDNQIGRVIEREMVNQ